MFDPPMTPTHRQKTETRCRRGFGEMKQSGARREGETRNDFYHDTMTQYYSIPSTTPQDCIQVAARNNSPQCLHGLATRDENSEILRPWAVAIAPTNSQRTHTHSPRDTRYHSLPKSNLMRERQDSTRRAFLHALYRNIDVDASRETNCALVAVLIFVLFKILTDEKRKAKP